MHLVLGVRGSEHRHDGGERGGHRTIDDGGLQRTHFMNTPEIQNNSQTGHVERRIIACMHQFVGACQDNSWHSVVGVRTASEQTSEKPFSESVGRSWYSPTKAMYSAVRYLRHRTTISPHSPRRYATTPLGAGCGWIGLQSCSHPRTA